MIRLFASQFHSQFQSSEDAPLIASHRFTEALQRCFNVPNPSGIVLETGEQRFVIIVIKRSVKIRVTQFGVTQVWVSDIRIPLVGITNIWISK
jgi:hypothetical protein